MVRPGHKALHCSCIYRLAFDPLPLLPSLGALGFPCRHFSGFITHVCVHLVSVCCHQSTFVCHGLVEPRIPYYVRVWAGWVYNVFFSLSRTSRLSDSPRTLLQRRNIGRCALRGQAHSAQPPSLPSPHSQQLGWAGGGQLVGAQLN